MKNILKIFSLLMLLLCTVLLASCGDALSVKSVQADPYGAIMDASAKLDEAAAALFRGPAATLEKLAEGVSTYEVKVSIPDTADVGLEVVADAQSGAFSGEASVGIQGVSVTGEIWGDKNQFALSLPVLLGDDAYGLKFDTFMEDLENSSTLATFGLSWADLKAQLGLDIDGIMEGLSADKLVASFETYRAEAEAVMKDKTPTVAEDETGVITVTYTLTRDDMVKFSELALGMVEELFGDLMDTAEIDMDEENIPEDFTYTYYLDQKTGSLLKIDMDMDGLECTVNYSTDAAKPLDITYEVTMPVEGDLTGTVKGTLRQVTETGKGGFVLELKAIIDGETTDATLSFIRSTADGKYELKMTVPDMGEILIGGELTYTETSLRFTVDTVSIPDMDEEIGKFTFAAEVGGTVDPMPAYKNALMLTEDDLVAIFENFQ